MLAAHGTRRNPRTGAHEPPSASRCAAAGAAGRGSAGGGAVGLPGGRGAGPAAGGPDRRAPWRHEERRRDEEAAPQAARPARRCARPGPMAGCRPSTGHPSLDPAATGDPGHRPARPAVGVDGKERKLAKAGGRTKVHLLGAVTHGTGLVIGQDKVAKAGKANEITHFRPLLEPLPLAGVVITADAMQTQREHARWLTEDKDAFYLLPVLGNQPETYAAIDALDWKNTPVAAATSEISRGRVETRTIRVLPAPAGLGFPYARQAILLERYVTIKNGRWVMRNCEAVLYVTSLNTGQASLADLLAYARGHWTGVCQVNGVT